MAFGRQYVLASIEYRANVQLGAIVTSIATDALIIVCPANKFSYNRLANVDQWSVYFESCQEFLLLE